MILDAHLIGYSYFRRSNDWLLRFQNLAWLVIMILDSHLIGYSYFKRSNDWLLRFQNLAWLVIMILDAHLIGCSNFRRSPCIPYLIGYYETKIHTLLVTEYLKGGELFHKAGLFGI